MSFFNRRHFFSSDMGEEMKGVIGDLLGKGGMPSGPWQPPVDMLECADGYLARFELAGVCAEDLEVRVVADSLHVRGVRRERCDHAKKAYLQMEIHHGPFERSVRLPGPVRAGGAAAHFADGMLEVFLPTARKRTPRMTALRITLR